MPFRERNERSASPRSTRCSSPNLKLRYAQARRYSSSKGGVTPFCAETPLSSTGKSITIVRELDLTNRAQAPRLRLLSNPKTSAFLSLAFSGTILDLARSPTTSACKLKLHFQMAAELFSPAKGHLLTGMNFLQLSQSFIEAHWR